MANFTTRTQTAYDYHTQQVHYLHRDVAYNTPQIQTTAGSKVYVGALPANCLPMETIVRIKTSFDGLLIVGTSSDTDSFATTADVTAGTTGTYVVDRAYGTVTTVDLPVYVQLTTGSTVGEADVFVTFMPAR